MAHPNEPSLYELKIRRKGLYAAPSTDDNLRRIKAIEVQIERKEAASEGCAVCGKARMICTGEDAHTRTFENNGTPWQLLPDGSELCPEHAEPIPTT